MEWNFISGFWSVHVIIHCSAHGHWLDCGNYGIYNYYISDPSWGWRLRMVVIISLLMYQLTDYHTACMEVVWFKFLLHVLQFQLSSSKSFSFIQMQPIWNHSLQVSCWIIILLLSDWWNYMQYTENWFIWIILSFVWQMFPGKGCKFSASKQEIKWLLNKDGLYWWLCWRVLSKV